MSQNTVIIEGKATKVKINKAGDGRVVNFMLAYWNGPNAEAPGYIPVSYWRHTVTQLKKFKRAGEEPVRVCVVGRVTQDVWEDNDGDTQYATKLLASRVHFADDPPKSNYDDDDDNKGNKYRNKKGKKSKKYGNPKKRKFNKKRREEVDEEFEDEDGDDVPFDDGADE